MGLHRFKPVPSGRMGTLWTLSTIKDAAVIEFGCMGHMLYSGVTLKHAAVYEGGWMVSTHIDETDIALGKTERLFYTVENVVKTYQPKAIFLLPSSIPEVIGTDLESLSEEIRRLYPHIDCIAFGEGGFKTYLHQGVKGALNRLVAFLPVETEKSSHATYNIIGSCADLFHFHEDALEIGRVLEGAFGIEPACVLTSRTSVDEIKSMGKAHINIVLRHEGLLAAETLKKRFGTPYIFCRPYGMRATLDFIDRVSEIITIEPNTTFIEQEVKTLEAQLKPIIPQLKHLVHAHPDEADLHLGGHVDVVKGILAYGREAFSFKEGICWCDDPQITKGDIVYLKEQEWSIHGKRFEKGFLMASAEVLTWYKKSLALQISNPDIQWRLHPYMPPLVGFRGAICLAELWINEVSDH